MTAVYLSPQSGFSTPLRSDTLWGLLLVGLRMVHSDSKVADLLYACEQGQPPFVVSSAFPFQISQSTITHYFPSPMVCFHHDTIDKILSDEDRRNVIERMNAAKKFKKIKYIPEDVFQRFVNGELSTKEHFDKLHSDKDWAKKFSSLNISAGDILHSSIDRLSNSTAIDQEGAGQLFYTHEHYVENGGLYFLVEGDVELILPALRFLQHFGFGGDNSVGKGIFTVETKEFSLQKPTKPTHILSLSLYSPTADELHAYRLSKQYWGYEIEIRRGTVGTHFYNTGKYRKKPVAQFTEGSLFPFIGEKTLGKVHTVHSDHSFHIRHNGFAFAVPYLLKEE